jgi:hypothetical protein
MLLATTDEQDTTPLNEDNSTPVIIIVLIVIIVGLVMLVIVISVVVVAVKCTKRTEALDPTVVNYPEAVYDTIPDVIGGVTELEMRRTQIPDPPPIHSIHSLFNPPVGLTEVVGGDELTRNEAYGDTGENVELTRNEAYGDIGENVELTRNEAYGDIGEDVELTINPADESRV